MNLYVFISTPRNMTICEFDDCKKRVISHKYCATHRCSKKSCRECVFQNFSTCEQHTARCFVCPKYTEIRYCENHKCLVEKCNNIREKFYDKCELHRCSVYGCANIKNADTYCCTVHKCVAENCTCTKLPLLDYCERHRCNVCGEFNSNMEKREKMFCDRHGCDVCGSDLQTNAYIIKNRSLVLCDIHYSSCGNINCETKKQFGYYHCSQHICGVCSCRELATRKIEYGDNDRHIFLCSFHDEMAIKMAEISCYFPLKKGKYCSNLLCENKVIPRQISCLNHYWKPKCLYCLSDGECTKLCKHKCDMPCKNKMCTDVVYMRKNKTKYDYHLLSRTKFIEDNAQNILMFQIWKIVAEYLW